MEASAIVQEMGLTLPQWLEEVCEQCQEEGEWWTKDREEAAAVSDRTGDGEETGKRRSGRDGGRSLALLAPLRLPHMRERQDMS